MPTGKAPGEDGIPSAALKRAPRILSICLAAIFQVLINYNHFPHCWKNAIITLIPKSNKDHTASAYQPFVTSW